MRRQKHLTATSEKESRPRGRPEEISREQLVASRELAVQLLELRWGEVGWSLLQAQEPDAIASALAPLSQYGLNYSLNCLLRGAKCSSAPSSCRGIRERLEQLHSLHARQWSEREDEAKLVEQLDAALGDTTTGQRDYISRRLQTRKMHLQELDQAAADHRKKEEELRAEFAACEACFARQQLFQFISSGRYAFTPLALANAVAGLPFITCRRSYERCARMNSPNAGSTHYEVFTFVRNVIQSLGRKASPDLAVATFKTAIMQGLPGGTARDELMAKWYFLDIAVRQVFGTIVPADARAFRITALYYRWFHGPSTSVDWVMATEHALE
jgi:hypothetical protein